MTADLIDSKKSTDKYITILFNTFSVDNYNKFLLEKYIEAYSLKKAMMFEEKDQKNL